MNTDTSPTPTPTPLCAAFDALLPLLNTDALSAGEAAATREHVAGCGWCRAQLDAYEALEARYAPPLRTRRGQAGGCSPVHIGGDHVC